MAEKHLFNPQPPPAGVTPCSQACNTNYEQEQNVSFGGAAVLRMMLGCERVGLNPLPLQSDFYTYAHAQNDPGEPATLWYVDPKGMHDALMHFKPATFTNFFVNFNFPSSGPPTPTDQDAANARLIVTIDHYEVAPAALCNNGQQWVAVVGYVTDVNGLLTAVYIDDPSPPPNVGTGIGNQLVASTQWNTYFSRVMNGSVAWQGKFVTVCDPKQPERDVPAAVEKPRANGEEIIAPERMLEFAQEILIERGLVTPPEPLPPKVDSSLRLHRAALQELKPATPQLVHVLDGSDQFYYLLRYQIEELDALVLLVDARFGTFIEAITFPKPIRFFAIAPDDIPAILQQGLPREESVEAVRERILNHVMQNADLREPGGIPPGNIARLREAIDGELFRLRQPLEQLRVWPELIHIHPVMAWHPNPYSMSMLYPYYQINFLSFQIYIRANDGKIIISFDPLFGVRLGG